MEFSDTAILILVMAWGVILTLTVGGGLILSIVANARQEQPTRQPPGATPRREGKMEAL